MDIDAEEFVTHSEGFGDCILISLLNRRYLLSCGADGDIRILDLSGEKEPNDLYIGRSPLYQLAFTRGKEPGVAFACEDNTLYWIELNPVDFSKHKRKILTRFGSAVYAVASDESGQWLAGGAADFLIKLIPVNTISTNCPKCHILDSHAAPVLSLSFSSDGRTLCSSSCDGLLMVWCTDTQTLKNKLPILTPRVSDLPLSPSRLILAVSSRGSDLCLIATPHVPPNKEQHCIAVISSHNYQIVARLTSDTSAVTKTEGRSSGMFHCCCWSPDGRHLAAGTEQGHILIWSCSLADSQQPCFQLVKLLRHTLRGEIISVCWRPSLSLAALSKSGYLLLHESLQLTDGSVDRSVPVDSEENSLLDGIAATDLFDSQDSPPQTDAIKPRKPQAMELDEASRETSNSSPDKPFPAISPRKPAKKRKFVPEVEEVELMDPEYSHSAHSAPPEPEYEPEPGLSRQESFQPSSWPLVSEVSEWEHACLCYNLVGVVISHIPPGACDSENDNKHSSYLIEVNFHDRGVHHPLQLVDPHDFSLGVLTEEVLVLGGSGKRCPVPQLEDTNKNIIQVRRFNTWDGSKEWTASLPEGENARSLAAGMGWVACITDSCILRLFGCEGTQFDLLLLPGTPLASAGRDDRLIVAFHQNSALLDSQCLSYYLLSVSQRMSLCLLSEGVLSLSPLSELRWLGLSVSSLPVTLDSVGHLQVGRVSTRGVLWIPMLDFNKEIRKKRYARCVVILGITPSLSEGEGQTSNLTTEEIRYILPSHGAQYPDLQPRPSVQCKSYAPPLCPTSSDKCPLEKNYFLSSFSHGHSARETQEGLMRIFALAARSGYFQRAMEVGKLLTPHYKEMAITYSTQLQIPVLCKRLNSLLAAEQEFLNSHANPHSVLPSTSRTDTAEMNTNAHLQPVADENNDFGSSLPEEEIGHFLSGAKSSRENVPNIFSTGHSNPFKQKQSAAARASSIDKSFIKSVIQKSMGGKQPPNDSSKKVDAVGVASRQSKLTGDINILLRSDRAMEANAEIDAIIESNKANADTEVRVEPPQAGVTEKKSIGFREWLDQTLPLLEAESPHLNRSELVKLATKRWREEKS